MRLTQRLNEPERKRMFTVEVLDKTFNKRPKHGKCKKSCFANGWHRVADVPLYGNVDTGCKGVHAQEVCLECGKFFKARSFYCN